MLHRKEDEVIDRLLRAEVRREAALSGVCADFDPDLAAAYLERRLNNEERGSYETHLIQCHDCRTGIVRLAQLDGIEVAPYSGATMTQPGAKVSSRSGRPRWLAGLGASIFTPQWVVAAAAILIAVISVPLVLLRIAGLKSRPAAYQAQAGSTAKEPAPTFGTGSASGSGGQDQGGPETSGGAVAQKKDSIGEQANSDSAIGKDSERAQDNDKADGAGKPDADDNLLALAKAPASVAGKTEADESPGSSDRAGATEPSRQPTGAPVAAPGNAEPQKRRADAPSEQGETSVSVSGSRASAGPSGAASAGASSAKEADHKDAGLPRLDPDKAMRLSEDGGKTEVSVLKRGRASDQPQPTKEKAAAIKPQDSVAPPPESTTEEGMTHGRRAIAEPPGKEFVSESKPAEETHWDRNAATGPVKLAKGERRVEGKRFRLINGVWTDRGFKPNKEMASVTLVRDSEVYKALLAKEDTLRGYLSGFGASERAIIVYKKIVYKLTPAATSGTED